MLVGALGGAIFGFLMRRNPSRRETSWTISIFILLPIVAVAILLWPVLGTNYRGLPIGAARLITLIGFALSVVVFEQVLVLGLRFLGLRKPEDAAGEFTPTLGSRALILGGIGTLVVASGAGLLRKRYRAATLRYDGTQYKVRIVQ